MDQSYFAGNNNQWLYLGIDTPPPSGKIHVLTEGGISVIGNKNTAGIIAWAPLMKRDKAKEALQKKFAEDSEGLKKAAPHFMVTMTHEEIMMVENTLSKDESLYAGYGVPSSVIVKFAQKICKAYTKLKG